LTNIIYYITINDIFIIKLLFYKEEK